MRILAAQVNPTIGDLSGNTRKIIDALHRARRQKIDVVLFPEMTICGYFPDDLLLDPSFINQIEKQLDVIEPETKGMFVCVGLPRKNQTGMEKPLFNSAAIFIDGKLSGFKDKTLLPTYDVFDERRYFEPGAEQLVWEYQGKRIAVTICEDVWQHSKSVGYTHYRVDPVMDLVNKKPDLVLNLSASPYYYKRTDVRLSTFQAVAKTLKCPVILCNQVGANDQLVFDGHSLCIDGKGDLIEIAKGFVEEDLVIDLSEPKKVCDAPQGDLTDLYSALVLGVRDYFQKQGFKRAVVGLSGGIDSALVTYIAKDALGAENVLAITMPSRFSSKGSVDDSLSFAKGLGIEIKNISIEPIFKEYLSLLEPEFGGKALDATEENLQTRIRGMILMAFSNKTDALLLNTGNKSEMAVGYCTLYGDMAGGLGVLHDVTKLHVYQLAKWIGLPEEIIQKTPSAELKENQTDLDLLPPYEILDPILEDYIEEGLSVEKIAKKQGQSVKFVREIIRKIHSAEYKRRQAPISIRVTQKAFNRGRISPIVQKWR
ncbi:MAG: NAD+ synthase [Chlamydiae bacterium CG10_big_fil_rev_8_21_14_0_10_42_34]|nr:MAG: NAD+ synthase [Chlamydiae bacterium CG10_big_fil_rev_8_21_14_0_10_42_34]